MYKLLFLFLPILLFASTQKVSVQLEWRHQFEFAGLYMAKEQGYYREIGLDVEFIEFEDGINISDDVVAQKATFGISSSSLILDKLQNKPVVLLASYFKQNTLALVTSADIKNIADLKNKKIMIMPYELEHTSLGLMLEENNLKKGDYTLVKHDFNVEKFISGEVDAMSIFISNQTYILDKKKIDYNILNPSQYGIYSYDGELFTSEYFAVNNTKLVENFIQATNRGWEYAFANKNKTVNLIYNKYTSRKSREALLYEAKQIEKLFKTNIFKIGSIVPELIELNALIYAKLGLVHQHINLSELLNSYLFENINKDRHPDKDRELTSSSENKFLTQEEQNYLDTKQITMCIDPNWMPFEMMQDGKHIGMSADYFKLIEKKLNTKISIVPSTSWSESIELAKSRKCDLFSLAIKTQEREKYMNFTSSYLDTPLVLATNTDVPFIADFKTIHDKNIGIPKDYAFAEILRARYPNLNIVDVRNIKDGLTRVKSGELFGYIGTLASVGYMFQTEFTGELKIAGKFDEHWELGIAVRNDDDMLFTILQKVLDSVGKEENKNILNKWIAIKYEKATDYTLVWQILFIALLILSGTLYWNRRLSVVNKELQLAKNEAEEVTKAKANFLANMSHEIRTPMNSIVGMLYLIKETKLSKVQYDYIQKIENSSENLLKLINDILDFSKMEAKRLEVKNVDFNLLEILNNVENIFKLKTYEKGLEFKIIYDKSHSMHLYGDSLRLSQILTNLVSNAIKFTHSGKVELKVEKLPKKMYRFSISDTGIGLSDEYKNDIFSSFSQADSTITRKYGGTGLGLAISKELVELMGGKIWVESIFGKGSTFNFEVELRDSEIEIAHKLLKTREDETNHESKTLLDESRTKELFEELKKATKKRRPQLCEPILQELQRHKLDEKNQAIFNTISNLINRYKFDDARRLLDEES